MTWRQAKEAGRAATLLAVAAGMPTGRVALVCTAVLAGQASIGWSNDWLDADRDRAVARADKPVVQGAVGPALLRAAAPVAAATAVVLSLLLGLVPGLLLLYALVPLEPNVARKSTLVLPPWGVLPEVAPDDVFGTFILLEAARRAPRLRRFVQISTHQVYGSVPEGASRVE